MAKLGRTVGECGCKVQATALDAPPFANESTVFDLDPAGGCEERPCLWPGKETAFSPTGRPTDASCPGRQSEAGRRRALQHLGHSASDKHHHRADTASPGLPAPPRRLKPARGRRPVNTGGADVHTLTAAAAKGTASPLLRDRRHRLLAHPETARPRQPGRHARRPRVLGGHQRQEEEPGGGCHVGFRGGGVAVRPVASVLHRDGGRAW